MKEVLLVKAGGRRVRREPEESISTAPAPEAEQVGPAPAAKKPRRSVLLAVHEEILKENTEGAHHLPMTNPATSQVEIYLGEPVIGRGEDQLKYWRENKGRFPSLAPLAQAYLSAPCTSVESERLFSLAGNIVTDHRASLDPENVEMLLFVKKNLPHMFSREEMEELGLLKKYGLE